MTSGSAGSLVSAERGAASVALLLALLAATGCRESTLDPGVPESNVVVADDRERGDDPCVVNSAAIGGHRLTIEVSYAGGCRRHDFTLVISKSFRSRIQCSFRPCSPIMRTAIAARHG